MTAASAALTEVLLTSGARRIAFLGLAKNVGKTTALVATLAELHRRGIAAGTTSAGRDGEQFDAITGEPKPRFRLWPGQLIASAASTFDAASFPSTEIATLAFTTRFGPVMLRRAEGEGEIEVIGPSTVSQMGKTAAALEVAGADILLLDGAVGRRAFACGRVADGVVLSVGMAASDSLEGTLSAARGAVELIRLPSPSPESRNDPTKAPSRTWLCARARSARERSWWPKTSPPSFSRSRSAGASRTRTSRSPSAGRPGSSRSRRTRPPRPGRPLRRIASSRRWGQRAPALPCSTWSLTCGQARPPGYTFRPMPPKLGLSPEQIERCRRLAREVADGVRKETEQYTTLATERTVLRLLGVDGVDSDEVPVPNRVAASLQSAGKLSRGAAVWMGSALARGSASVAEAAALLADPGKAAGLAEHPRWREAITPHVDATLARIRANRAERDRRMASHAPEELPLLYAIVATGNIHEDVVQAEAAARAGAQCIAVIRSTAQSLLDHVPFGATTSGFGGTFATQENFRLMRAALDAIEPDIGRYVRLVNYCSGLCMPEIAAMGALERLDMMLNDALYGIIFRDINPLRTLIDQNFSRRIIAVAGS